MQIEPTWWITAVEAPIIGGLFWLVQTLRRDLHERLDRADLRETTALAQARENLDAYKLEVAQRYAPLALEAARNGRDAREELADFKLEVARTYVPLSVIRDVDRRLSQQLLRIEEKLEEVRVRGAARAAREARAEEDAA